MSDFLKALTERVVVFDGAMGTNLQSQNLSPDDFAGLDGCNEILVETKPEAVERVHAGFLEVGCDVVETDTFGATSVVLAEYDIAHRAYELNLKAAQLAKRVASDFSTKERPRWVAGSMGPTTKLPSLGHITFRDMKASFAEQARGLLDGEGHSLVDGSSGQTGALAPVRRRNVAGLLDGYLLRPARRRKPLTGSVDELVQIVHRLQALREPPRRHGEDRWRVLHAPH